VDSLTLFAMGLVVSIPTTIVVVALVFAAGEDEREEERQRRGRDARTRTTGDEKAVATALGYVADVDRVDTGSA
jgi:hypothetical protein